MNEDGGDFRADTPPLTGIGNASIRVKLPPSMAITTTTSSSSSLSISSAVFNPSSATFVPAVTPSRRTLPVSPRRSASSPCLLVLSSPSSAQAIKSASASASASASSVSVSSIDSISLAAATKRKDEGLASSSRLARIRSASSALGSLKGQRRNTSLDPLVYGDPLLSSALVKPFFSLSSSVDTASGKKDPSSNDVSVWLGADFPGCDSSGCDLECEASLTLTEESLPSAYCEETFFDSTTTSGTSDDANDADRSEIEDVFLSIHKSKHGKPSPFFGRPSQTNQKKRQKLDDGRCSYAEDMEDDDDHDDDDDDLPLSQLVASTRLLEVCDDEQDDDDRNWTRSLHKSAELVPPAADPFLSDSSASIWNDDDEDVTIHARQQKVRFIGSSPFPRPPIAHKNTVQRLEERAHVGQKASTNQLERATYASTKVNASAIHGICCGSHGVSSNPSLSKAKTSLPTAHKSIWSMSSPLRNTPPGKQCAVPMPPMLRSRKSAGQFRDDDMCWGEASMEHQSPSSNRPMLLRRALSTSHMLTNADHSPGRHALILNGHMRQCAHYPGDFQETCYDENIKMEEPPRARIASYPYAAEESVQHAYFHPSYVHQHMPEPLGPSPNNKKGELYKTEMCRSWSEMGTCRYAEKCQFAHGPQELRAAPAYAYTFGVPHNAVTSPSASYFASHAGSYPPFLHRQAPTKDLRASAPAAYERGSGGALASGQNRQRYSLHSAAGLPVSEHHAMVRKRSESAYVGYEHQLVSPEGRRRSVSSPSKVRMYTHGDRPHAAQYAGWAAPRSFGGDNDDENDYDEPLASPFTPITPHCYKAPALWNQGENHTIALEMSHLRNSIRPGDSAGNKKIESRRISEDDKLFAALQAEADSAPVPSRNIYHNYA